MVDLKYHCPLYHKNCKIIINAETQYNEIFLWRKGYQMPALRESISRGYLFFFVKKGHKYVF